ncbi:ABC transporter permease [Marinicella sp. W31]|uniref:ABC transporter permease n=1 Tax=Marinicella sp. W31 TaxID=3023713 RepID=UPI0037583105
MHPLNRKLFRQLWKLKGQVLAIALVISSGVATLIMALSTVESLQLTTDTYYERAKFADIFAQVKRAPERLSKKISSVPGVKSIQTRITEFAILDIENFQEPIIARINSVPEDGQPLLNQLVIKKGRWLTPGRTDEVIISEPFAEAHHLNIGDEIQLIMNGYKRPFNIVAVALSPEFIYSLGPGALLPDDQRFGILWMGRHTMAAAYDLKEAFNDVVLSVDANVEISSLLTYLDELLKPYGGTQSISRDDQISHWFVKNEIKQQKTMSTILPGIFLLVAVFLTHMVLSRLITTERNEIGLLKAFGYSTIHVGWHYTKMILLIVLLGLILGFILGYALGHYNTEMYATFLRFPLLVYQPGFEPFLIAATVSVLAAFLGAMDAVRKATRLRPATAMQPPTPAAYGDRFVASGFLKKYFDQPTRIAFRQIHRWPFRAFLTCLGIALSLGLMMMSMQWRDSFDFLASITFHEAQRQDIVIGLNADQPRRAIHDLENLPGVLRAEPSRMIPVKMSQGVHSHRGSIIGVDTSAILQPIYDEGLRTVKPVPESGLVMARKLAEKLDVKIGDSIWVETMEGQQTSADVPVVDIIETYLGMSAFMNIAAVEELQRESPGLRFANLLIDEVDEAALYKALKNTPKVSAVMVKKAAIDAFYDTLVENVMVFITIFTFLAMVLGFGVVYNSTRIALSERGRELATLRVLGFSQGETSYVLLGEVIFLILLGLPLGGLVGLGLVSLIAAGFETELFRVPLIIEPSTYGLAIILMLMITAISVILVRYRINRLNLIKVLKTRE